MPSACERHLIFSHLAERIHHRRVAAEALAEWLIRLNDDSALASRRLLSRLERASIGPDDGPTVPPAARDPPGSAA